MNQPPFDADRFARDLARQLDEQPLTLRQSERLKAARLQALAHAQPASVAVGQLAGAAGWLQRQQHAHQRAWLAAALALVMGIAIAGWWQGQADSYDDEVDAQLLADELPPEVYLTEQADRLSHGS